MTLISNKKKERNHYFYNKKYQKKDKNWFKEYHSSHSVNSVLLSL